MGERGFNKETDRECKKLYNGRTGVEIRQLTEYVTWKDD